MTGSNKSLSEDTCEDTLEDTREDVFARDGRACWLCGNDEVCLTISHQIDAAATGAFSRFQDNGTIPTIVTDVSHRDNLLPLCPNCHSNYEAAFPGWVLIPDPTTIQKYIDHEKIDYEHRTLLSHDSPVPPRTLPLINRNEVKYHPLIITHNYKTYLGNPKWPKRWLGEPTTTIHRAARRGLLESSPVQPFRLPGRGRARFWQTGVPEIFVKLVAELFELWARQPPITQKKNGV